MLANKKETRKKNEFSNAIIAPLSFGKLKVNSDLLGDEINVDKKLVTCRETGGELKKKPVAFLP